MKNKQTKRSLQERYDALQLYCQEICEHVKDLENEAVQDNNELRYLYEFISYKNLADEYRYFRENAHEEFDDEHPFPNLTL